MTNQEWLPEEIEHLLQTVRSVLNEGGTKSQAFKQFAKENRVRTENAARYKWISMSAHPESETLMDRTRETSQPERHGKVREMGTVSRIGKARKTVLESDNNFSITDNLTEVLYKYQTLRDQLNKLTSQVKKLSVENAALKKENEQFVRAFQLARQHLTANPFSQHNNYIIRVGRDGVVESVSANG